MLTKNSTEDAKINYSSVVDIKSWQVRACSQINQHQQMPTAASRTSCERQIENPLARSCPLLTQMTP